MSAPKKYFGVTKEGHEVYIYTLKNTRGMSIEVLNYGGIIASINVPDKKGNIEDIVLGYDNLDSYINNNPCFGTIIGRCANRIGNSEFEINHVKYKVTPNEGKNHCHGGTKGFDKVIWECEPNDGCKSQSLKLSYFSKDGEEGFPGNLDVKVAYTLTEENSLEIDYYALSDKDTVVNLTNHTYFNLLGHGKGNILNHQLKIYGDRFTVINEELIPIGEIRTVKGSPMDFLDFKYICIGLMSEDEQIKIANGFDHNWVLNKAPNELKLIAQVFEERSGREMKVYTTKPGVQFYTGNCLNNTFVGKQGKAYSKYDGFCLETQFFPNSINQTNFPSSLLKAGSIYSHKTIYSFAVV